VIADMFSEHTFSFVALHKVIVAIVKHLGMLTAFHVNHGETLESLSNEFEDRDDDMFNNNLKSDIDNSNMDKFFGHAKVTEKVGAFSTAKKMDFGNSNYNSQNRNTNKKSNNDIEFTLNKNDCKKQKTFSEYKFKLNNNQNQK
jgi:hypothetical protein